MDQIPTPLYETVGAALGDQARRHGNKTALIFGTRHTSFAELDRRANEIASALLQRQCGPGTTIGVLARNSDRYAELLFGAARAGALTLTLNWRLARAELEYIAQDAKLRALFYDSAFAEEAHNLKGRNPDLVLVSLDDEATAAMSIEQFRTSSVPSAALEPIDPNSWVLLIYTSGTTGPPKGILISHVDILTNIAQMQLGLGTAGSRPDDIVLLSPPLFHIGGLCILIGSICFGSETIVLHEAKVAKIVAAIERHEVTRALLIPSLMPQIIEAAKAGARLDSLKTVLYGMSPVPEAVLTQLLDICDCTFAQSYGMTETSGVATLLGPEQHFPGSARLTSCGRAVPGTRLMIRRADNSEAAVGEPGEVLLRSPSLAASMLQGSRTAPVRLQDGWYETGDIGYLDQEGFLYLCDRKKDMIISGGENIFSVEVENIISQHPHVERVAVIGVPSAKWGEEVKAIVLPQPGAPRDPDAIIAFAQERLARFKVPKSIEFIQAMPVTSVGKIAKNILRERYWQGKDRRIN